MVPALATIGCLFPPASLGGLLLGGTAAVAALYSDSSAGGLMLGGVATVGQFNVTKRVKPRLVTVTPLGPGFVKVAKRQRVQ